ncbi:luciferase family oxidoreductase group 1 [Paenibacillus cellulosilyticus]|uniref:Luciferase family oxidoreductase group 1 n=1 Tax=Paenibacillus cellulosilyticus TaxID=375489 RepID=A0A2V2YPG2_9BACL|nr:LLM class flavin-dependent oxidoreductase [Paenibacillus cellulosilyticus]PWV98369.1 luciferase family oxidoreductase group 1 [Paenibacillus cellulosilyticus]QKS43221.1 LLM class flavin-dependent oxidoreductase [Paenibacillus cellulosilyticus]
MKIGILDQAPIAKGNTASGALQNAVETARVAEELGYHRMWLAEHHNLATLASSAPEITASFIAAKTNRIRVGTGGIMAMHYSPYKMAEVFKTLSALAPGRVDFGVGRAPGGDHRSTQALAEGRPYLPTDLYDKIRTTLDLISGQSITDSLHDGLVATPAEIRLPEAWLLGSTGNSAVRTGRLGVGYSFAQFFNGEMSKEIFDAYKSSFVPSTFMEKPVINVTYSISIAETREEAEYIALPVDLSRLFLMKGRIQQPLTPEEALEYPLTASDRALIQSNRDRKLHLVGTASEIADQLQADQQALGFDEIMISASAPTQQIRLNQLRLLARELL